MVEGEKKNNQIDNLVIDKSKKSEKKTLIFRHGKWTEREHERFIEASCLFNSSKKWKKVLF